MKSKLIPGLLAVLFFGLPLFSSLQAQTDKLEKAIEGVYVFSGIREGNARILQFRDRQFLLKTTDGFEIRGRYLVNGQVDGLGILNLHYFDGREWVNTECSIGILDGKLWVGVFISGFNNRNSEIQMMVLKNPGILGFDEKRTLTGRILWNFFSNKMNYIAEPGKTITSNVRRIELPDDNDDKNGKLFAVVDSEVRDLFEEVKPGVYFWKQFGILFRNPEWSVESEADAKAATVADVLKKTGVKPFIKVDSVLIPPWSRCLGPVGLLPDQSNPNQAVGKWDNEIEVFPATESNHVELSFHALPFGVPDESALQNQTNKLVFSPDVHGFNVKSWGWNCNMGHADYPGFVIWFPTSDGKLVRFITAATHGLIDPTQSPKIEIHEKADKQ